MSHAYNGGGVLLGLAHGIISQVYWSRTASLHQCYFEHLYAGILQILDPSQKGLICLRSICNVV